ncbi:hypothetical protein WMF04_21385 [Sorangium sp. So ce260]|uniref:hypothetical protein n=1 Tax=Sorangium sp. So ce260 TaxID=3133291 RepID=UPI003F5F31E2
MAATSRFVAASTRELSIRATGLSPAIALPAGGGELPFQKKTATPAPTVCDLCGSLRA